MSVAGTITGELQELDNQRAGLVRRGKILWTVKDVLPKASKSATMAVTTRNRAEALKKVEAAYKGYLQCEEMMEAALKEEKGLAKFTFLWLGAKKNAAWLRTHCKANRRITERMVTRLSGKKPPKKKEVKETKETKQPTKKKKKKRQRTGRIRRW